MIRARRLLAVAAFLAACDGVPSASPDAAPRSRVVLLGDSITAGRVSQPVGPPYAELLRQRLGPSWEVVNLGCGGSSSLDWTRSRGAVMCGGETALPNLYEARAQPALPARFVTVLLGTNDSRGIQERRRIPPDQYAAALGEIATSLLEDGAERVVVLRPPLSLDRTPTLLRIVKYGEAVQALCDQNPRVLCGPNMHSVLAQEDFEQGNVHPNASGHAKLAAALADYLLALPPASASAASTSSSAPGSAQSESAPAETSSSRLP